MFAGVLVACLSLVVVLLAAQRAPRTVLDRQASRRRSPRGKGKTSDCPRPDGIRLPASGDQSGEA